jgi:hypothetical protein
MKEDLKMALIENVTFLYAKVQSPVLAYNKVDTEWSVDVVCSKADAKKIKKEFPKTSLKEFDNADFTEKFGIEPPFPKQDEQFILKFKKSHVKNGKETPEKYRPRVIQQVGEDREDITFDKLVGNGSKGTLSYRIKETDTYGNFAELQAILVTDLVEYQSKGGGVTDDFGPVKLAEAPAQERVVVKQGEAPAAQEDPEDSFYSENLPF